MTRSSKYWDKRALKRLSDAEKMSEEHIKRIKKMYDKAFKDIDKEIQNVYKNYSKDTGLDVDKLKELLTRSETKKTWEQMKRHGLDKYIKNNYKARISRLEQIQAQIYAKAKQIYPKEELEHTMAYKGVINDSYYKAVYDTQMGTGYAFNFSKIDKNLLDSILNERWSGKNYSERIWGNTDILAESLSEVVGGGLMSGQSVYKMSRQIKERFNVSKYYAERLVRTETNHFNNTADAMAYEEMGIDYYVFVATLDNRTSEICQTMDGKKFKYSEKEEGVNYPPLHPNCRSKTRGYIDEDVEKTLKRRARNPITGKNELIDNMSYKEWAKKNGLIAENNKKIVKIDKKTPKNTQKITKSKEKYKNIESVFGAGVKLNGIDPNYQVEIKNEFIKIANKYPIDTTRTILKTNSAKRQIGHSWNCIKAKWNKNWRMYDVGLRDEITLNKNDYITKTKSIETHKRAIEYYKKPYEGDLSTLWHEYGHQISSKYAIATHKEVLKGLDFDKLLKGYNLGRYDDDLHDQFNLFRAYNNNLRTNAMSNVIHEKLFEYMKSQDPTYTRMSFARDKGDYLGTYALTDKEEFLAEGFTAMNLIDEKDQSDFVKAFAKVFNEEFDKVFRR